MSKKTKWLIVLFSIVLVAVTTLSLLTIFVFTKTKPEKIQLEKPSIDILDDGTKKLLVSDNNLNANGYAFYVYDGDDYKKTYDYIMNKTEKGTFYLNVTDLFTEAKKYYFFCQCLGDEQFDDSEISEIKSFQNKFTMEVPELAINDNELSWTNVKNSSGYKIYMNGSLLAQTAQRKYDISNALDKSNKTENTFYVCAVGNEFYYDSEKSNIVKCDKTISYLSDISNFRMNSTQTKLLWSGVENADKYQIIFNDITMFTTTSTEYDFASLLNTSGIYTFKVRAVRGNDIFSNYTNTLVLTKKQKLNKVENLQTLKDTDKIILSWDEVDNAINYQVVIKANNIELSREKISTNAISIEKQDGISNITVEIVTVGYNYYEDSAVASINLQF